MSKRFFLTATLVLVLAATAFARGKAKYVFYFIGDGMGVNQVNGTETFLAARAGLSPATLSLGFGDFPVAGLVNTQSATNGVTDSAAGGTALASGCKTRNGAVGVLPDSTAVPSLAELAHRAGAAVGVATSVSIDHATPAAFYAHMPSRQMYYEIGSQLASSGFDFFAGSDFLSPDKEGHPNLYKLCEEAGYQVVRGRKAFLERGTKQGRVLLLQTEEESKRNRGAISYAIDRCPGDLSLTDITRSAVEHLSSLPAARKEGFFLMVEGGQIDWACHSNDVATMLHEVIDMDNAIGVALEFYRKHPKETLIVVTADHETGGIVLGTGAYTLHLDRLAHQRLSAEAYSRHVGELRRSMPDSLFTWDVVRKDLEEYWGFDSKFKLTDNNRKNLRRAYEAIAKGMGEDKKSLYSKENALANTARAVMAERAHVSWASGGHSNGYVPVFAIGKGSEKFVGRMDNTSIPKKICEAAEWE